MRHEVSAPKRDRYDASLARLAKRGIQGKSILLQMEKGKDWLKDWRECVSERGGKGISLKLPY